MYIPVDGADVDLALVVFDSDRWSSHRIGQLPLLSASEAVVVVVNVSQVVIVLLQGDVVNPTD